ncbi:MAG: hypothetical protein Q7S09_05325 [bacterium]|nr:hypothetical protein [bacterium]
MSLSLPDVVRRKKQPFRIGTDLDGVVIDHTENFLKVCSEFGCRLEPWQTNSNILHEYVPEEFKERIKKEVYDVRRMKSRLMPDFLDLDFLFFENLIVASVQKVAAAEEKVWQWLGEQKILDRLPKSSISIFRTRQAKIEYLNQVKPDFFIDDGLDVLEFLDTSIVPILFDPLGVHERIPVPNDVHVVRGWHEIQQLFGAFTKAKEDAPVMH